MGFNEILYELRKKEGLSQEELAEKVNVSRQTVSKWEMGQSTPEMDKLILLSSIFNISIDELVGNNKNDEVKSEITNVKPKHILLKILILICIIYIVVSLYKYISLTIMNNIGNSFSEESYSIMLSHRASDYDGSVITIDFNILKIKNKIIENSYNMYDYEKPYHIEYIDLDKKERFEITYVEEEGKYVLMGDNKTIGNEDEINEYFTSYENLDSFKTYAGVNKYTIGYKLKMALNPCVIVNIFTKRIIVCVPFGFKAVYEYNNDYLLNRAFIKYWDTDKFVEENISYDYVPGHFENREIENPIESGKYEIVER